MHEGRYHGVGVVKGKSMQSTAQKACVHQRTLLYIEESNFDGDTCEPFQLLCTN